MMELTAVMPQHIQSTGNTLQCQPPLHLPSSLSFSNSCPLPSIPSSTWIEPHIPPFSPQNNNHHQFSLNNNNQCPIYDMNWPLTLNNNQCHPIYDTNFPSYPLFPTNVPVYQSNNNNINPHQNFLSPTPLPPQQYLFPSLPTLKELSNPSSPMYILILTGRSDWCPWSEALTMAVIGMICTEQVWSQLCFHPWLNSCLYAFHPYPRCSTQFLILVPLITSSRIKHFSGHTTLHRLSLLKLLTVVYSKSWLKATSKFGCSVAGRPLFWSFMTASMLPLLLLT